MQFIPDIQISPVMTFIIILGALYIVYTGHPEWALAIYLATALWTRTIVIGIHLSITLWKITITIGPFAHTWVFMATTVGASIVYKLKHVNNPWIPSRDRWIVPWLIIWWLWMLLLIGLFNPAEKMPLLRSLLLYVIFPLPIILLFAQDLKRIRGFAVTFLVSTLIGGWVALSMENLSLQYVLHNPSLIESGTIRLGIINYQWFAYAFAISMIIIVALFLESTHLYQRILLLLSAIYCAYFLMVAGSRQTIAAVALVMLVYALWALTRKGISRVHVILVVGTIVLVGIVLYLAAPNLLVRSTETGLNEAFNIFASRGVYWKKGWQVFLGSPIWGAGFTQIYSHNFFIGTLADQGLVGMVFLIGFLVFLWKQGRGIWARGIEDKIAIWRMAFLCTALFGLIHSQASGNAISVWYLYWSGALLWGLGETQRRNIASSEEYSGGRTLQPVQIIS